MLYDSSSLLVGQAEFYGSKKAWKILPLLVGKKNPYLSNGFKGASNDVSQIKSWWDYNPNFNIGISTGKENGILIIDIDGDEGLKCLNTWQAQGHDLLEKPTCVSISGRPSRFSLSFWYKYPIKYDIGSNAKRLNAGIDIRANDGYVVAPPSVHPNGGSKYTWIHWTDELAEVPQWVLILLLAASAGRKTKRGKDISVSPWREPKPDWENAREQYLYLTGQVHIDGQEEPFTAWATNAKKALKGTDSFDVCINQSFVWPDENSHRRWETLRSIVAQASALLFRNKDTSRGYTPTLLYALMSDHVQQIPGEDEDWDSICWNMCVAYYLLDKTQQEQERVEAAEVEVVSTSIVSQIIAGAKTWGGELANKKASPGLWGLNCTSPEEWIKQRLVVFCNDSYFVMNQNGFFNRHPVKKEQIIAKLRIAGLGGTVVSLTRTTKTGETPVTPANIIDSHGYHVSSVKGVVGTPERQGAYLDQTNDEILVIPLYWRRSDLEPVFDERCDAWLREFLGKEYERGVQWIAHSLDFEGGPICALSLVGPKGAGKQMFMRGLAECINTQFFAQKEDLVGKFQGPLKRTGFLNCNEGFPKDSRYRNIPDAFRAYTAGDPILVEDKYVSKIEVNNPLRIVLTANDHDMLAELTGGQNLNIDSREAIAERVLHIDIPETAPKWLEEKGGPEFTKGWVMSHQGESDFVLAKHFLYLYKYCRKPQGSRYLVGGNLMEKDLATKFMTTKTTGALKVLQTLVKIVEGKASGLGDGVFIEKETQQIWVTISAIIDGYNNEVGRNSKDTLREREVGQILRLFREEGKKPVRTRRFTQKMAVWFDIRSDLLLEAALENGWPNIQLRKICNQAKVVELCGSDGIGSNQDSSGPKNSLVEKVHLLQHPQPS